MMIWLELGGDQKVTGLLSFKKNNPIIINNFEKQTNQNDCLFLINIIGQDA